MKHPNQNNEDINKISNIIYSIKSNDIDKKQKNDLINNYFKNKISLFTLYLITRGSSREIEDFLITYFLFFIILI